MLEVHGPFVRHIMTCPDTVELYQGSRATSHANEKEGVPSSRFPILIEKNTHVTGYK